MPKLGDNIPLKFQLGLEETNKYVRAYVTDEDDAAISGSPFALTHVSGGFYSKTNVAMPNNTSVTARYYVYDDAGFTTRTTGYEPVIETFELTQDASTAIAGTTNFELDAVLETIELDAILETTEIVAEIEVC